jgi:hypothetical protein
MTTIYSDNSQLFRYLYIPVQGSHNFNLYDVQILGNLSVGPIQILTSSSDYVTLYSSSPTGGIPPYTYQWFRYIESGFEPTLETLIADSSSLQISVETLPVYYYILRVTDSVFSVADSLEFRVVAVTPPSTTQLITRSDCVRTNTYYCGVGVASCNASAVCKKALIPAITVCNCRDRINFNLI